MVKMGEYNTLKVIKVKDMGVFMDNEEEGILMPKRFVPPATKIGDELKVSYIMTGRADPSLLPRSPSAS
jgi:predicted RNA-binding protein (virulence factor B family)